MQFSFDEEQRLFQSALREYLEKECPPDRLRELWTTDTGRSDEIWRGLADLGIVGLSVPEAQEGSGRNEIDSVLLYEEVGRAGLAEPLDSTSAVAVPLLMQLADAELAERWLKAIAVGDARVALADPVSAFVSDAHVADLLILQGAGGDLHAVSREGAKLEAQPANDPARKLFTVTFEESPETRIASDANAQVLIAAALDRGALAASAQQIGVADRLIAMAVDYARERKQFGKPIGSFQAVKHMLADVKVALEYARPVVYRAAHSVASESTRRAEHVSMAKLAASRAAKRAARVSLQVHGAIGYTWEQDLHIWMRRAWSLARAWGREDFHEARVGDSILDAAARIGPGATFAGD